MKFSKPTYRGLVAVENTLLNSKRGISEERRLSDEYLMTLRSLTDGQATYAHRTRATTIQRYEDVGDAAPPPRRRRDEFHAA